MKKLEFKTVINVPQQKVWETMLDPTTYKEWVNVSWPGSYFEGTWKKGEDVKFISPGQGGTKATLVDVKPHEFILAKHVAVINADGSEDRKSDVAAGWIGTTERYTFTKLGKNSTELKVEVDANPEWEQMFNEGWPNALEKLKEVSERDN